MSHPHDDQKKTPLQASIEALGSSATTTHCQAVPGNSPAVYVGDPSSDLLSIDALDLLPDPPVE